jgi:hypothetical protein
MLTSAELDEIFDASGYMGSSAVLTLRAVADARKRLAVMDTV